jgi:hypothetical protein
MNEKTPDYSKYLASRQDSLGKLVNALRSDPVLLADFGKDATAVAKRYSLTLAGDEAARITDLVIANPGGGELDAGLLEAVAGGDTNYGCGNNYKCAK